MTTHAIVVGLVVLTIGCEHKNTPTGPSSGQAPSGVVLRTVIMTAPEFVTPWSVTPLKLVAVRSDNTREDVTGQAAWSSTNPDILRVADGGVATAIDTGEAGVTGSYGGLSDRKVVTVLEAGTFRVTGVVADSGFGLAGAHVEVASGVGAGKATTTDSGGNYKLFGLAGDVQMRASLDGFESETKTTNISPNQTRVSFTLKPLIPPADLSGDWHLTFDASSSCAMLPEIARRRIYTATVEQSVSALIIRLSGAEFAPDSAGFPGGRMNQFRGRVYRDSVTIKLETYDYYGTHYDLGEILPDRRVLTIVGDGTGTITASTVSGTLKGTFRVVDAGSTPGTTNCVAEDHRFSFVRRSVTSRR
jgi:hypothetical protein